MSRLLDTATRILLGWRFRGWLRERSCVRACVSCRFAASVALVLSAGTLVCAGNALAQATPGRTDVGPKVAPTSEAADAGTAVTPAPGQAPSNSETPDDAGGQPSASNASTVSKSEAAANASAPGTSSTAAAGENAGSAPQPKSGGEALGLFEQSQAQAGSAESNAGGEGSDLRALDLGGYVRGDMYVGKVPDAKQGMIKAGYGELALKFRARKEQFGDAFAELRLRDGLQGPKRDLFVDLREAYANGYFGPLDIRLGKQIIVWGRADAFNPTNNLTPIDLRIRSPVEDDRRVGNIGVRTFLNLAPVRLEGVWMPIYAASELPSFKLPNSVFFGDTKYPPPTLGNGLGAGRVHLEFPAIEMSVSYVHGYAPLPGLTLQSYTYGVTPTVILVSRTAYDQDVVGFDFSTAIGELLGVRGEAAYRHPVDYQHRIYAPHPDVQYVFGVDHSFGPVSVIAQYLGRYVFDWRRENGPANPIDPAVLAGFTTLTPIIIQQINDTVTGELLQKNQVLFAQTERVQHLASLRVEWLTLHDTLSLSALCLVNFTTREWLAFPKIGYQISDHLSTAVGSEIYMGPDGTLFGLIKEELSAGYAELKYSF